MSQEPANAHKFAALSLDKINGLFPAQLYGWLIRSHEAGATFVPEDIAQNVNKADALVHAFIRSRAAAQLEYAGYLEAARAMRFPIRSRELAVRIEPAQGCHAELNSRRYERGEGAAGPSSRGTPASTTRDPAELLERLETIIEQFERAEAIGSALARIILCALLYASPGAISAPHSIRLDAGRSARPIGAVSEANRREIRRRRRVGLSPSTITPVGQGPPYSWPPPSPPIPVKTGIHASGSSSVLVSKAWTPAFAGVGGGKGSAPVSKNIARRARSP